MGEATKFDFSEPWDLAIAAGLVILSGLVAGLTIGIMGIDQLELRVQEERGTVEEKKRIQRLYGLLSHHHMILVALLLVNTICQETLPLFLNRMFPEWATIVFAVTIVLVFGEIIPQALCSGSQRIPIVRFFSPFIMVVTWIFWPLAWPIAKLLDWLIGAHSEKYYGRADLKTVVRLHERSARLDEKAKQRSGGISDELTGREDGLLSDEVIVIEGALDMANKAVKEIMVPLDKVYALEETSIVDQKLRRTIVSMGHSRIPVYRENKDNIIGVLLVKHLVAAPEGFEESTPRAFTVTDFLCMKHCPMFVRPDYNLYELMNDLQTGHHMALVTNDPEWHAERWAKQVSVGLAIDPLPEDKSIVGIVTIEDVFEELIQEEIYDEFDRADMATINAGPTSALPAIVKAMKIVSKGGDDSSPTNSAENKLCIEAPKKMVSIIRLNKSPANDRQAPSGLEQSTNIVVKEEDGS